jgi:hypothetical protein
MGLTENTATALLAQNGLEVRPNSAVSVEDMEAGLAGEDQKVAVLTPSESLSLAVQTGIVDEEATDMAREIAYGLAKKAYGFQREPGSRA